MLRLQILISLTLYSAPAVADFWTFETPSQNIQCSVVEESDFTDLKCTIINRQGSPARPKPSYCHSEWGHSFEMRDRGPVRMNCAPLDGSVRGQRVAAYGVRSDFGGFTCISSGEGLMCRNRDKSGFFLSRRRQIVFGTNQNTRNDGKVGLETAPSTFSWRDFDVDHTMRGAGIEYHGAKLNLYCPKQPGMDDQAFMKFYFDDDVLDGTVTFVFSNGYELPAIIKQNRFSVSDVKTGSYFNTLVDKLKSENSVLIRSDQGKVVRIPLKGSSQALRDCYVNEANLTGRANDRPLQAGKTIGHDEETQHQLQDEHDLANTGSNLKPVADAVSPAIEQSIPPRAKEGSAATPEQWKKLAELRGCPTETSLALKCVLKKYNLHASHIKYPMFKLANIYNDYIDYLTHGPREEEIQFVDSKKRVRVTTTHMPNMAICPKAATITFSFDMNKSKQQQFRPSEISNVIQMGLINSIAKSPCTDIKIVHLVFEGDGVEFAREDYAVEYGYILRTYSANTGDMKAYSAQLSKSIVEKLYQKGGSLVKDETQDILNKLNMEANVNFDNTNMAAVLTGKFDEISFDSSGKREPVLFDIVYSFFDRVGREVISNTNRASRATCYPNGSYAYSWTQTATPVDSFGNPTGASTSRTFTDQIDPRMVPVYNAFESNLGGRTVASYLMAGAVIEVYGCNSEVYKKLFTNIVHLGEVAIGKAEIKREKAVKYSRDDHLTFVNNCLSREYSLSQAKIGDCVCKAFVVSKIAPSSEIFKNAGIYLEYLKGADLDRYSSDYAKVCEYRNRGNYRPEVLELWDSLARDIR